MTQVEWMPTKPCTPECLSYWGGRCKDGGRCDSFNDYLKLVQAQTKLLEYLIAIPDEQDITRYMLESMLKQLEEQK